MLGRTSILVKSAAQPVANIPPSIFACVSVRWRKRRWVPKAPSKIFKVPVKPRVPEEEYRELVTRGRHYKLAMRTLRNHLFQEYNKSLQQQRAAGEVAAAKYAEHWKELMAYNDAWNAQSASYREARFAAIKKKQEDKYLRQMMKEEAALEETRQKAQQLVAQTQEAAKHFITEENMEAAIEHALDNKVEFNFAIDTAGNRYYGTDMSAQTSDSAEGASVTQKDSSAKEQGTSV